jgi:hypothetical protein
VFNQKSLAMIKFFHVPTILLALITTVMSGIIGNVLTPYFDLTFFQAAVASTLILWTFKFIDSKRPKEKSFFNVLFFGLEESEKIYKQNKGIVCLRLDRSKN